MTYKDLFELLSRIDLNSPIFDRTITVYDPNIEEYFGIQGYGISDSADTLDPDSLFLVMNED